LAANRVSAGIGPGESATQPNSRAISREFGGVVLAQLGNISLSGCYVLTPQKLAEHTRVRLILQTGSRKADLWGVIRRQDQNGLGIQFTNGTTVEDWKSLEHIIEQLQTTKRHAASAGCQ
jgi:hypothetical protein